MTIEKIINESANLLGLDAPKGTPNYRMLWRCANLTVSNVAYNYFNDYHSKPEFRRCSDKLSTIYPKLNDNALIYGIMAEYATLNTLPEEYEMYNNRFEKHLFGLARTKGLRRLPA